MVKCLEGRVYFWLQCSWRCWEVVDLLIRDCDEKCKFYTIKIELPLQSSETLGTTHELI